MWVDAESLLIQKVFEDTPKGYAHRSDLTSHDYLRAVDLYFEYYDHNASSAGHKISMPTHQGLWMLKGELEIWNGASKVYKVYSRAKGGQVSALVSVGTSPNTLPF